MKKPTHFIANLHLLPTHQKHRKKGFTQGPPRDQVPGTFLPAIKMSK